MLRLQEHNINTSEYWDRVYNSEILGGKERVALERFKRVETLIPVNAKVLDVGCGTGEALRYLEKTRPDCNLTGIDFSKIAIEHNKKLSHSSQFIVGDITTLSQYFHSEFDVVICFETIEHLSEPAKFVNELLKTVKKDGMVIITAPFEDRVKGGDEHIFSFNFFDFLDMFSMPDVDVVELSRYSTALKNMMCILKLRKN